MKVLVFSAVVALSPMSATVLGPHQTEATQPTTVEQAETILRILIEGLRSGDVAYDVFTPRMAEQIRAQQVAMRPMLQNFGAIQSVEHAGKDVSAAGADIFIVKFDKASARWSLNFDEEGKISGLGVRPAG